MYNSITDIDPQSFQRIRGVKYVKVIGSTVIIKTEPFRAKHRKWPFRLAYRLVFRFNGYCEAPKVSLDWRWSPSVIFWRVCRRLFVGRLGFFSGRRCIHPNIYESGSLCLGNLLDSYVVAVEDGDHDIAVNLAMLILLESESA